MTTQLPQPKKIAVTLEVTSDAEARDLQEAWIEIVSGEKLSRAEALEHATEAVMERARPALEIIERAIREHPTTGQAGRLVRFLAGLYNGQDYPRRRPSRVTRAGWPRSPRTPAGGDRSIAR
jgi:hypothetical protein